MRCCLPPAIPGTSVADPFGTRCALQVQMTTTDWEECGFWLAAVKRLIKMRQQGM